MAYPFYNYPQYPQFNAQPMPDQLQQFRMQQIQQPAQAQQTAQDEKIYVQGRGSAEAYLVAPGAFVRLWDSTDNVFYEKRADQTGRPYMETYRYERCDQQKQEHDYQAQIKALEDRIAALEGARYATAEPTTINTGVPAIQAEF